MFVRMMIIMNCSGVSNENRVCACVCVCETSLGGDIFVRWTKRARTFFLARTFFRSLENVCVFL